MVESFAVAGWLDWSEIWGCGWPDAVVVTFVAVATTLAAFVAVAAIVAVAILVVVVAMTLAAFVAVAVVVAVVAVAVVTIPNWFNLFLAWVVAA